MLDELRSEFGQENELTENRALVHEYLGITINYSITGKVVFTMFNYLEDVILECAKDLKNSRSYYPGNNKLFKVHEDLQRLLPEDTDLFHHHVARLLLGSKRARSDIHVCVAFLYTRVKLRTEQDHRKLRRVIDYLKETVIGADIRGVLT